MKRKLIILIILLLFNILFILGISETNRLIETNKWMIYLNSSIDTSITDEPSQEVEKFDYNGEQIETIGQKIDRVYAKTSLEGYGEYIAKNAVSKGVNPYLISGIILESTSCKTECSIIFKQCNNVAGMKGEPGCFGGSYRVYKDIPEGIVDLINYISKNFNEEEMQNPNNMFKKYGKNVSWAFKVSEYMESIKRAK